MSLYYYKMGGRDFPPPREVDMDRRITNLNISENMKTNFLKRSYFEGGSYKDLI